MSKIIERLKVFGVPSEYLVRLQPGVTEYYKDNRSQLPGLVRAILPINEAKKDMKAVHFQDTMVWLQWLMFEGNPVPVFKDLSGIGEHGVCGAVWGKNETAYRCRTCQKDYTCAICVSCFEHGNHKDHEYSTIYTRGGCCDCGDVTAWKRDGFCSNHKGQEHIQPLSTELAKSMAPVLDILFHYWETSLKLADSANDGALIANRAVLDSAFCIVTAVLHMLLEMCNCSRSLLSFITERMVSSVDLKIFLSAERFLSLEDAEKLQKLLLKMLSISFFKCRFAKTFLSYYPTVVDEAVKQCSDARFVNYSLFSAISVQIFTVPTLILPLVKDNLVMLLECVGKIFASCAGVDGRLQVNKWGYLYEITLHVLKNVLFVMRHASDAKYALHDDEEIIKMWIKLLAFVQGMDPQKRETEVHIEEENEHRLLPFVLCNSIEYINSLLVVGEFCKSSIEDKDEEKNLVTSQRSSHDSYNYSLRLRPAKVRKLREESSVSSAAGRNSIVDFNSGAVNKDSVKLSCGIIVSCLTNECLKAIESRLRTNATENSTELEASSLLSMPYWPNLSYDVTSPSVYIPLHRLFSKIVWRAARKYNAEFNLPKTACSLDSSSTTSFLENFIGGYQPHGFSACLMEHPLRIRVFCAQVHAGMWRKNGNAATIISEEYLSIWWSADGLELDLFLLQFCAALSPADLFVNRLLERFGLSTYLDLDLAQSNGYEPVLMQELLTLLIQIVNERRFCGQSEIDSLKREFVRTLAIGDATHSELVKSVPHDLAEVDAFEEILDTVAIQSDLNKGLYALRPEYWKELNLYHPCWNSKELQIVEERYLHFCHTSARTSQLPKWTKIYEPFNEIARIATCKVVLHIIRAVLFYGVNTDESVAPRAPYSVLMTALHLLSLGIDIYIEQTKSGNVFTNVGDSFSLHDFAEEEIKTAHSRRCVPQNLLSLLRELAHKKSEAASLIETIMKKLTEYESVTSCCL